MGKICDDIFFIFNNSIYIYNKNGKLFITREMDDYHFFSHFIIETKELEESHGFGRNDKLPDKSWLIDPRWYWKEMSK